MSEPTPEEIAKVEAWQKRQRYEEVKAILLARVDTSKRIVYQGVDVTEDWEKGALIALLHIAYDEINRPGILPTLERR